MTFVEAVCVGVVFGATLFVRNACIDAQTNHPLNTTPRIYHRVVYTKEGSPYYKIEGVLVPVSAVRPHNCTKEEDDFAVIIDKPQKGDIMCIEGWALKFFKEIN